MTNSTLDMSCGADAIARNWRSWLSGDNTCAPPPALSQTGNECEDLACDSGKKRRGSCASNEAEQSVVLRKKHQDLLLRMLFFRVTLVRRM
jgi:hypothetical protein